MAAKGSPKIDTTVEWIAHLLSSLECEGTVFAPQSRLTDYRQCHDSTPREARILFTARSSSVGEEAVVKVKVQLNDDTTLPKTACSTTTATELEALELFRDQALATAPQLISFRRIVQDDQGPLPGGYVTFTIMTKMPGTNLLDYKYWSAGFEERSQIQQGFIRALKQLWAVGIAPTDRALRNVMWEPATKQVSIVDFEVWERPSGLAMDEEKELQRWGLAQRPPPGTWIDEWRLQH